MPSRSTGISDHHIRIHHDTHKYRRRRCADKLGDRCFLACGIPVVMCCSLFLLGTLGASAFFLPLGSVQHHSQAADWLIKLQSHSGRGPPFRRRGTGGCTSGDRGGQLRLSAAPAEVVERVRRGCAVHVYRQFELICDRARSQCCCGSSKWLQRCVLGCGDQ